MRHILSPFCETKEGERSIITQDGGIYAELKYCFRKGIEVIDFLKRIYAEMRQRFENGIIVCLALPKIYAGTELRYENGIDQALENDRIYAR